MKIDCSDRRDRACWCGVMQHKKVAERRQEGYSFDVVKCSACGTWRILRPLSQKAMGEYYRQAAKVRLERGFFSSGVDNYKRIVPEIEAAGVKFSKGKRVLDVGCNLGYFLHVVAPKVKAVYGVENLNEYLVYCRKLGISVYKNIKDIPYKMDIVAAQYLLEHIPSPLSMLGAIKDVMKKNGRLVVRVPGNPSIEHAIENRHDNPIFAHLFFFTAKTLGDLVGRAGFKLVKPVIDPKPNTLHWVLKIAS